MRSFFFHSSWCTPSAGGGGGDELHCPKGDVALVVARATARPDPWLPGALCASREWRSTWAPTHQGCNVGWCPGTHTSHTPHRSHTLYTPHIIHIPLINFKHSTHTTWTHLTHSLHRSHTPQSLFVHSSHHSSQWTPSSHTPHAPITHTSHILHLRNEKWFEKL